MPSRAPALLLLLAACASGSPPAERPQRLAGIQGLVEQAADERGVPRPLAIALAWVDSRLSMNGGALSGDHAVGLFYLVDELDRWEAAARLQPGLAPLSAWSPLLRARSLQAAAAAIGLSPDALRTDPLAHARGALALLRSEMDRLEASYPDLRDDRLGDWYEVVMRHAGVEDARLADGYAAQVYRVLLDGLSAELPQGSVRVVPQDALPAGRAIWAELEQDLSADYCPGGSCISFVPASPSNYAAGRGGARVTTIVIHDMEGSYAGSIAWFQNPAAQACAHYNLRSSDGQITQMVADADTAWHAGNHAVNVTSIGIEHEGYAAQGGTWFTEKMYASSAALVRWLSDTYGIPRDRSHILGHYEVPDPGHAGWFGGGSNHHDPCDAWRGDPTQGNVKACFWSWDHYLALVNGTTSTAVLSGFVGDACCGIDAGTRKPIVGAVVGLAEAAATATTGADGFYSFTLPPGAYTPVARAPGYTPGDHSSIPGGYLATVTLATGATTWASILLAPTSTVVRIAIQQPVDSAVATSSPVLVRGSVTGPAVQSVLVNGQSFPVVAGAFAGSAELAPGLNTIVASASSSGGGASAAVHVSYAPPSTGVAGKVTNGAGSPLGGVSISLTPALRLAAALSASSRPDGSYSLVAPAGSYVITFSLAGYAPVAAQLLVPASRVLSYDARLLPPVGPAPRVAILQPNDGATVTSSPLLVAGTIDDRSIASVQIGGRTFQATSSRFSGSAELVVGPNTITVSAVNAGGQGNATVHVTYLEPAEAAPQLLVDAPLDGQVLDSLQVVVQGRALVPLPAQVSVEGQPAATDDQGRFQLALRLEQGARQVVVTATDAAGARYMARVAVFAPQLRVDEPLEGQQLPARDVLVQGRAAVPLPASVSVNGLRAAIDDSGNYSLDVLLGPGPQAIVVTATDANGSTYTTRRSVTAPGSPTSTAAAAGGGGGCGSSPAGLPGLLPLLLTLLGRRSRAARGPRGGRAPDGPPPRPRGASSSLRTG